MYSAFVIAAATSGSGKTTLSLGLMRCLKRRGLRVAPFKCGPDYIDTQFHAIASGGISSVNLDSFMAPSASHITNLYRRYASTADVAVVEGVMGLFDGYNRMAGSTAEIARILSLPIVLVVDSRSTAYSVAATIHGFRTFRPDINVVGVIFNRVASPRHYKFLRDAASDAGVECFGHIGRDERLQTTSRHLGLTLTGRREMNTFIDAAADAVSRTVDIDALLRVTATSAPTPLLASGNTVNKTSPLRIAVARDDAFNFIYRANIDALRESPRRKVEIIEFSPLTDSALPPDTDFLYLPGGYPELYAEQLAANKSMRNSIAAFARSGKPVLAECGGMIYLCHDIDGLPMAGFFPMSCTMKDSHLHLGYRQTTINGVSLRGHEFHYSDTIGSDPDADISAVLTDARGRTVATPIYRKHGVIAGYTHFYWGDTDILRFWNI